MYARHGHELIGCKSLVSEPLYVKRTAITSERQLRSREACVGRKPVAKQLSRRTETSYKAESVGKLARDNEAPGSADTVNDAVVLLKFMFPSQAGDKPLSGEICLIMRCSSLW